MCIEKGRGLTFFVSSCCLREIKNIWHLQPISSVWKPLAFLLVTLSNWCFWTVVLEQTLESPLDYKEINPVKPKGNQSWIFLGKTDAEAKAPILWTHDVKSWLIRKSYDAGKDWRQEKKGTTEDETVGWHHWLDGHEFKQVPGVGDGQGSLVYSSPWGFKESEVTEWLNWTEQNNCYEKYWKSRRKDLPQLKI